MKTQNIGVSGEYFVAAELSRRGYIANITLRNAFGVDILVTSDLNPGKSISIQVKAKDDESPEWILTKKSESLKSKHLVYVFVRDMVIGNLPKYHIVPSDLVSKYCGESHSKWLNGKKKDGTNRRDSDMRKFRDHELAYLDKWDTIFRKLS